jgi:hypothetical protein
MWSYARDLVLTFIDDMLRNVDKNEEDKGIDELSH